MHGVKAIAVLLGLILSLLVPTATALPPPSPTFLEGALLYEEDWDSLPLAGWTLNNGAQRGCEDARSAPCSLTLPWAVSGPSASRRVDVPQLPSITVSFHAKAIPISGWGTSTSLYIRGDWGETRLANLVGDRSYLETTIYGVDRVSVALREGTYCGAWPEGWHEGRITFDGRTRTASLTALDAAGAVAFVCGTSWMVTAPSPTLELAFTGNGARIDDVKVEAGTIHESPVVVAFDAEEVPFDGNQFLPNVPEQVTVGAVGTPHVCRVRPYCEQAPFTDLCEDTYNDCPPRVELVPQTTVPLPPSPVTYPEGILVVDPRGASVDPDSGAVTLDLRASGEASAQGHDVVAGAMICAG